MRRFKPSRTCMAVANVAVMIVLMAISTGATQAIEQAVNPVIDLINSLLTPLLAVVGALGTLYCVILGVKFAKAEEPQDREKAKASLKQAIIGFVLIFVLMLALKLLMPALIDWVAANGAAETTPID